MEPRRAGLLSGWVNQHTDLNNQLKEWARPEPTVITHVDFDGASGSETKTRIIVRRIVEKCCRADRDRRQGGFEQLDKLDKKVIAGEYRPPRVFICTGKNNMGDSRRGFWKAIVAGTIGGVA